MKGSLATIVWHHLRINDTKDHTDIRQDGTSNTLPQPFGTLSFSFLVQRRPSSLLFGTATPSAAVVWLDGMPLSTHGRTIFPLFVVKLLVFIVVDGSMDWVSVMQTSTVGTPVRRSSSCIIIIIIQATIIFAIVAIVK
jgi:hypothetical protein